MYVIMFLLNIACFNKDLNKVRSAITLQVNFINYIDNVRGIRKERSRLVP